MRRAKVIELHSAGILLDCSFGGGIFTTFPEEKYELGYTFSKWMLQLLNATYLGVGKMREEDLHVIKVYHTETGITDLKAEILPYGHLDIEVTRESDAGVPWVQRVTYSGSFSVCWEDEEASEQ